MYVLLASKSLMAAKFCRLCRQGEWSEQGDPLMPMLYALGQHQALLAVQSQLLPNEPLMAFHDDVSRRGLANGTTC